MKNKKLQYVLFPLAIVVWGIIFYKIFSGLQSGKQVYSNENYLLTAEEGDSVPDTFTIVANYRDPFLRSGGTVVNQQKTGPKSVIPQKVRQVNNQQTFVQWPQISYHGVIVNEKDKTVTALMNVNNKNLLLRQGDQYADMTVKAVFDDSVRLSYMGQSKTFIKSDQ